MSGWKAEAGPGGPCNQAVKHAARAGRAVSTPEADYESTRVTTYRCSPGPRTAHAADCLGSGVRHHGAAPRRRRAAGARAGSYTRSGHGVTAPVRARPAGLAALLRVALPGCQR